MNTLKQWLHNVIIMITIWGHFDRFYVDLEWASFEVLTGLASSLHRCCGHLHKRLDPNWSWYNLVIFLQCGDRNQALLIQSHYRFKSSPHVISAEKTSLERAPLIWPTAALVAPPQMSHDQDNCVILDWYKKMARKTHLRSSMWAS